MAWVGLGQWQIDLSGSDLRAGRGGGGEKPPLWCGVWLVAEPALQAA